MNRQIILNQLNLQNKAEGDKQYLKQLSDCAQLISAVGDANRLMIMLELMQGPRSVSELAKRLGSDVSNASHHLKILKRAGLVVAQREAKQQFHSIAPGVVVPAKGRRPARIDLGCCSIALSKSK